MAQFYETGLVPKELWGFGEDLRKKFHTTKSVLLKVRNCVTGLYLHTSGRLACLLRHFAMAGLKLNLLPNGPSRSGQDVTH